MKKLLGVIGSGMIGRDPFDEKSWSGSSKYFFSACLKAGLMERAIGVEAPAYLKIPLMAANFSFDHETWRHKFYLDTKYYDVLTFEICKGLRGNLGPCNIIQIGGIYDVPGCMNGICECYSYHDGNLAVALRSPYWPKMIPPDMITEALEYEREVYQRLDRIFTMSDYLRRSFMEDFGVPGDKVVTIGAGVNLDAIPQVKGKDYEKKNILFIGVEFARKGGECLLQAFRLVKDRFPDARLHIMGPKSLKIPHGCSNGVIFHGYVSRKNRHQKELFDSVVHDASIFVMPSLYEPFGIAPLEAMAHEIPCILTNNWAFPEMVRPGVNGDLVACGDTEELAHKINYFLANPDLLQSMGRAAKGVVRDKYTWDTVVRRLADHIS